MQHDHLQFFNNSANGNVVPRVNFSASSAQAGAVPSVDESEGGHRDFIRVVEYIKKMPAGMKVSTFDIASDLKIDVENDRSLLEILKSNPELECQIDNDGRNCFKYRTKFDIRNKYDLKQTLVASNIGILLAEVENCYPGIREEVMEMIRGGEIIGVENKTLKDFVLFSRGAQPFYSTLSGTVTAKHDEKVVATSEDLTTEVRRGEAVLVGQFWYRVSSEVHVGAKQSQPQRARAPASVTMDKDMSDKNEYVFNFDKSSLPLDGTFEDREGFTGPIWKHGATNDVRSLWRESAQALKDGNFLQDELRLVDVLKDHIQYNRQSLLNARANRDGRGRGKGRRGGGPRGAKNFMVGAGANAHLQGSSIEKALREVGREQLAKLQK